MPDLLFYRGSQQILCFPISGEVRLGRHPENDLSLPDEGVSRFHCRIFTDQGGFWLEDKSRNGTFVNGSRVEKTALKDRDEIEIGPWRVRFVDSSDWADRETVVKKKGAFPQSLCGIIGVSPPMKGVFERIEKLGPLSVPVLILGETGSGKELVARALHELSPRARRPFIVINCGAISPQLIESELFGHERGAFTGAMDRHPGAFEQASGGTLFLDEVGELPLELQPKLLRVLEGQTFRRVGGREDVRSDVRLVAATHRDLQRQVREGKFREDLFFRLFTVPVRLPPLRERVEDIPILVEHFLSELHPQGQRRLAAASWEKIRKHHWKGNVRELKNTILRALLLSTREEIESEAIEFASSGVVESPSLNETEREAIVNALNSTKGNKTQAAKALGIAKSTLFEKLKLYEIKD